MEHYITLASVECLSSSLFVGLYFRRWKEMALFQHQPFFLFDSPLFILIGVVLNSSVLSLKLSEESVVLRLS
jgi:hypothetical protein